MASAATATGATITEVRVTGCKGLSAAVTGWLSSSVLPEEKRFSAHSVPEKNSTTTTRADTSVRTDRPKGRDVFLLMGSAESSLFIRPFYAASMCHFLTELPQTEVNRP